MLLAVVGAGCFGDDDQHAADEVIADMSEAVELAEVDDESVLGVFFSAERFRAATGAETVEVRMLPYDPSSFVIVAEREEPFDADSLPELAQITEDVAASERLEPAAGDDDALVSACCVARIVDGVAVLAGDRDGVLVEAVLAL